MLVVMILGLLLTPVGADEDYQRSGAALLADCEKYRGSDDREVAEGVAWRVLFMPINIRPE